jgi:hypothetical protein
MSCFLEQTEEMSRVVVKGFLTSSRNGHPQHRHVFTNLEALQAMLLGFFGGFHCTGMAH